MNGYSYFKPMELNFIYVLNGVNNSNVNLKHRLTC